MATREYTSRGRAELKLDGATFFARASLFELAELEAAFGDIDAADNALAMAAFQEIFARLFCDCGALLDATAATQQAGADPGPTPAHREACQYLSFRRHCADHGTDGDTLFQILVDVVEDLSGRPTVRLPDSAAGPGSTGRMLKVVSADGSHRFEPLTPEREEQLRAAVDAAALEAADMTTADGASTAA